MDQHCWKAKTTMNMDTINTGGKMLKTSPLLATIIVNFSQVMFCDLPYTVAWFPMLHNNNCSTYS